MSKTHPVFGFHAVKSRLRQNPGSIKEIYVNNARRDQRVRELVKLADFKDISLIQCDNQRLDRIAGNKRHQGVIAFVETIMHDQCIEDVLESLASGSVRLLVLDGVQDPHNLGACLRVADAFGVHAVIAPKDRAVGLTAAVYKVASGAADHIPYISVTNLVRTLRTIQEYGIWVVGADHQAQTGLNTLKLEGSIAWVLGSEGQGLRRLTRECCDRVVNIPMLGSVQNLNVSVCAGICLFETARQQTFAINRLP